MNKTDKAQPKWVKKSEIGDALNKSTSDELRTYSIPTAVTPSELLPKPKEPTDKKAEKSANDGNAS